MFNSGSVKQPLEPLCRCVLMLNLLEDFQGVDVQRMNPTWVQSSCQMQ